MRNPDGTETLAALAFPLSLTLVAAILQAIDEACESAGYADAALLTDGSGRIVARPKAGR